MLRKGERVRVLASDFPGIPVGSRGRVTHNPLHSSIPDTIGVRIENGAQAGFNLEALEPDIDWNNPEEVEAWLAT